VVEAQPDWLQSFDSDDAAVRAMARALDIGAPLGDPFPCVLHAEKNASASLYKASETGQWLYHDFHHGRHESPEWLTLATVRAMRCGIGPKLSRPMHATFKLVLLAEAGLLAPVAIAARPAPAEASGLVRHVYERFLFLLGCRWNYTRGDPMPFDRKFAAAFCGLSEQSARFSIDQLQFHGCIYVASRDGRTRHWLPAPANASTNGRHE
jgi:hypothetical protein